MDEITPNEMIKSLVQGFFSYKSSKDKSLVATSTVMLIEALETTCTCLCVCGEPFVRIIDTDALVDVLTKILTLVNTDPRTTTGIDVLAMRAMALVADTVPRGCEVISKPHWRTIPVLIKYLGNTNLLLTNPELAEELLRCMKFLSQVAQHTLLKHQVHSTLLSLQSLMAERHVRVLCLTAVNHLFSTARPEQWKTLGPCVAQLVECTQARMLLAFQREKPFVVSQEDQQYIFQFFESITAMCDRMLVNADLLRKHSKIVDDVVGLCGQLMQSSLLVHGLNGDRLRSAACSPLLSLYLTDPPTVLRSFLKYHVFEIVCNAILQLLDSPEESLKKMDNATTGPAMSGSEADSSTHRLSGGGAAANRSHGGDADAVASVLGPGSDDEELEEDRTETPTAHPDGVAGEVATDLEGGAAAVDPSDIVQPPAALVGHAHGGGTHADNAASNLAQLLLSDDVTAIPLIADELSVIPLLEFLLVVLPTAPRQHAHADCNSVTLPFHLWQWEDDFHNRNDCAEGLCRRIEREYQKQRVANQYSLCEVSHGNPLRKLLLDFSRMQFSNTAGMFPHNFSRTCLIGGYVHTQLNGFLTGCTCRRPLEEDGKRYRKSKKASKRRHSAVETPSMELSGPPLPPPLTSHFTIASTLLRNQEIPPPLPPPPPPQLQPPSAEGGAADEGRSSGATAATEHSSNHHSSVAVAGSSSSPPPQRQFNGFSFPSENTTSRGQAPRHASDEVGASSTPNAEVPVAPRRTSLEDGASRGGQQAQTNGSGGVSMQGTTGGRRGSGGAANTSTTVNGVETSHADTVSFSFGGERGGSLAVDATVATTTMTATTATTSANPVVQPGNSCCCWWLGPRASGPPSSPHTQSSSAPSVHQQSRSAMDLFNASGRPVRDMFADRTEAVLGSSSTRDAFLNEDALRVIWPTCVPALTAMVKNSVNSIVARHGATLLLRCVSLAVEFCQGEATSMTASVRAESGWFRAATPRMSSFYSRSKATKKVIRDMLHILFPTLSTALSYLLLTNSAEGFPLCGSSHPFRLYSEDEHMHTALLHAGISPEFSSFSLTVRAEMRMAAMDAMLLLMNYCASSNALATTAISPGIALVPGAGATAGAAGTVATVATIASGAHHGTDDHAAQGRCSSRETPPVTATPVSAVSPMSNTSGGATTATEFFTPQQKHVLFVGVQKKLLSLQTFVSVEERSNALTSYSLHGHGLSPQSRLDLRLEPSEDCRYHASCRRLNEEYGETLHRLLEKLEDKHPNNPAGGDSEADSSLSPLSLSQCAITSNAHAMQRGPRTKEVWVGSRSTRNPFSSPPTLTPRAGLPQDGGLSPSSSSAAAAAAAAAVGDGAGRRQGGGEERESPTLSHSGREDGQRSDDVDDVSPRRVEDPSQSDTAYSRQRAYQSRGASETGSVVGSEADAHRGRRRGVPRGVAEADGRLTALMLRHELQVRARELKDVTVEAVKPALALYEYLRTTNADLRALVLDASDVLSEVADRLLQWVTRRRQLYEKSVVSQEGSVSAQTEAVEEVAWLAKQRLDAVTQGKLLNLLNDLTHVVGERLGLAPQDLISSLLPRQPARFARRVRKSKASSAVEDLLWTPLLIKMECYSNDPTSRVQHDDTHRRTQHRHPNAAITNEATHEVYVAGQTLKYVPMELGLRSVLALPTATAGTFSSMVVELAWKQGGRAAAEMRRHPSGNATHPHARGSTSTLFPPSAPLSPRQLYRTRLGRRPSRTPQSMRPGLLEMLTNEMDGEDDVFRGTVEHRAFVEATPVSPTSPSASGGVETAVSPTPQPRQLARDTNEQGAGSPSGTRAPTSPPSSSHMVSPGPSRSPHTPARSPSGVGEGHGARPQRLCECAVARGAVGAEGGTSTPDGPHRRSEDTTVAPSQPPMAERGADVSAHPPTDKGAGAAAGNVRPARVYPVNLPPLTAVVGPSTVERPPAMVAAASPTAVSPTSPGQQASPRGGNASSTVPRNNGPAAATAGAEAKPAASSPSAAATTATPMEFRERIHPRRILFLVDGVPLLSPLTTLLDALCYYAESGASLRAFASGLAPRSRAQQMPSTGRGGSGRRAEELGSAAAALGGSISVHMLRALPFWTMAHRIEYLILERPLPSVWPGCSWCGCAGGPHDSPRAGLAFYCSPKHLFMQIRDEGNEPTDGALQLLLSLTQSLRIDDAPLGQLNGEQRRLSSALVHDIYSQIRAFMIPPLMGLTLPACVQGRADGHLASYALWNYPLIFPLEMRLTLLELFLSSRRAVSTKVLQATARWRHSPIGSRLLGFAWMGDEGVSIEGRRATVTVDRERIFESGTRILRRFAFCPFPLDVCFQGEPGIGLGPALEFYELMAEATLQPDRRMWRTELFDGLQGPERRVCALLYPSVAQSSEQFEVLGLLMARLLMLRRTTSLRFHPLFLRRLRGETLVDTPEDASRNMMLLDPDLERSLQLLEHMPEDQLAALELTFILPSNEPLSRDISLVVDGDKVFVTSQNVLYYTSLVRHMYLIRAGDVALQFFRTGLQLALNPLYLQLFSAEELGELLSGPEGKIWNSTAAFAKDVVASHGYTMDAPVVRYLLEVVPAWDAGRQRAFLRFITGASCPPIGGLSTPITVVRRDVDGGASTSAADGGSPPLPLPVMGVSTTSLSHTVVSMMSSAVGQPTAGSFAAAADYALPTVSTCFNYLKLPRYSSKAVLEERLLLAIQEGQGCFMLT